jgi:hypothetical protein
VAIVGRLLGLETGKAPTRLGLPMTLLPWAGAGSHSWMCCLGWPLELETGRVSRRLGLPTTAP